MNKDKLNNLYNLLVIALFIIIHLFFLAGMRPDFDIINTLQEPNAILHLTFTLISSVLVVNVGIDDGVEKGIETEEFKKADIVNDDLNLKMIPFRKEITKYSIVLNKEEKESLEQEFLADKGVLNVGELNKKQLKDFNNLKPMKHSVVGITLPLVFEEVKGNKVSYNANFDIGKFKKKKIISKVVLGILSGFMSVNIMVTFKSLGKAIPTILMLIANLVVLYLLNKRPIIITFKRTLPNKVKNKHTFWTGFNNRKNEFIELKEANVVEKVEPKIVLIEKKGE